MLIASLYNYYYFSAKNDGTKADKWCTYLQPMAVKTLIQSTALTSHVRNCNHGQVYLSVCIFAILSLAPHQQPTHAHAFFT